MTRTFLEEVTKEIKFALENGFTEIKRYEEKDGNIAFIGSFGYVVASNEEEVKAIDDLINQYVKVEKSEAELLREWEENNEAITIEKPKSEIIEGLTEKESKVLMAMYKHTDEFGLPVRVIEIKEETKYSKRSITGILSSLYKKGLVEEFQAEEYIKNEFMLSEEGYHKAEESY